MKPDKGTTRRIFLKNIAASGTSSLMGLSCLLVVNDEKLHIQKKDKDLVILFQGDSITDGNRTRNNDWNHIMGHGYAYLLASRLGYDYPARNYHFYNRGISGNTVQDLSDRWEKDTLDIKPDVLSILVGVNDLDRYIQGDRAFGKEDFEKRYRLLLQQTVKSLPGVQLVLCEPFILPVGKLKEKWNEYSTEIKERQKIVKQIAIDFKAIFIPCQTNFNEALKKAPAEYWIWDGIHPMPAGHELIARLWMHETKKKLSVI
jgi:lysophospholipase L1-like esterase